LLAKIPGLKVIARTSAFYHGPGKFNLRAPVELSRLFLSSLRLFLNLTTTYASRAETMNSY
jgi:hypothetical protein